MIAQDDVVDDLFADFKQQLIKKINENVKNGEQATDMLMVAKYFERIGDHATNIAEWVIYSITGEQMCIRDRFWVLYDVGNSAFTLLVSTIIPIYYKNMASANGISASDSTAYLSYAISISTLIVAVLGPVLGAVADNKNRKKPLFTFFMMMGVLGCAALAIPRTWILFLAIFVIAKVGFSGSLIFYDSMLVDVTTDERMDEVSSQGYEMCIRDRL